MDIQGLQKLTLLDYPGKTACTVFLGGCNFRCPFCHNSGLLEANAPAVLTLEDWHAFLNKRRAVLDGVCITGGEPLLRPDLDAFLYEIKERGYAVKLDTNGSFPQRLRPLVEKGLVDYVAMDIKNSPERYAQTVGYPLVELAPLEETVRYLLSGAVDYEFRTTVVRELHTRGDFEAIGQWIAGAKRYFLQSFVASDQVLVPGLHPCSPEELADFREAVRPYVKEVHLRGV